MNIPFPSNEFERLIQLSKYDLDYTELDSQFKDLSKLAAKIAGTEISLINLIDSFTQWSVASHGLNITQMPREESICQFTILEEDTFEVNNLHEDARFKEKPYVRHEPKLKYYYGVPLRNKEGFNLGSLCVLDTKTKIISPEKAELLKIIADEIVNRLNVLKTIQEMNDRLSSTSDSHKRVAHDIRGPIAAIIGLAQVIQDQGESNNLEEVLEFINLIHKSGKTLLDLTDEILSNEKSQKGKSLNFKDFNLTILAEKVKDMYSLQAKNKEILFQVTTKKRNLHIPFAKNNLIQIIGNLVSNAIKFTQSGGKVEVAIDLEITASKKTLLVDVWDDGLGMSKEKIAEILQGKASSSVGTEGEKGFGFGLNLVKHLVENMKGQIILESNQIEGTKFFLRLPLD